MNCNILDFGAKPDGVTLNTFAIQAAIDHCASTGGGVVTVPAGVFKSGTIWLKSKIELHLEMGAELLASDNMDDYNELDAFPQNYGSVSEEWVGKHLIIAHEIENCAITGLGKINGNCQAFVNETKTPEDKFFVWCNGVSTLKDEEKQRPGQLVCFIECKNLKVLDITIVNSPCWSCYLLGCEYAQIRGLKVFNPIWMLNSDGIDIDASRYVTVSDCIIETGDDAITLRACEQVAKNKDIHCEFVTISNCVLSTGICAFRIGVGIGAIRHARISNIVVKRCMELAQICTAYSPYCCANIEDVNFSNISAVGTDRCFNIFAKNGAFVRDLTFENIRATSRAVNNIVCEDGSIENLVFKNLKLTFSDKAPLSAMRPASKEFRGDYMLLCDGAKDITFDGVTLCGSLENVDKSAEMKNCEGIAVKDCNF